MPDFTGLGHFWVYLSASPLLGLTMTLCAYLAAQWIFRRSKGSPLANPVAISIALIAALLSLSGMSYQRYFSGAQFVHFLLGPATVVKNPIGSMPYFLKNGSVVLLKRSFRAGRRPGTFGARPVWRRVAGPDAIRFTLNLESNEPFQCITAQPRHESTQ